MNVATSSTTTPVIPAEIEAFFQTVYQKSPEVKDVKKDKVYAVPSEEGLAIVADSFNCKYVVAKHVPTHLNDVVRHAIDEFEKNCEKLKVNAIGVDFPMPFTARSLAILPDSFEIGRHEKRKCDLVRDFQKKQVRVYQWINDAKECEIPAGATHNLGAVALMIDQTTQKVLLVNTKRRNDAWNLPGGSYEPARDGDPADTALNEAKEEGGFALEGTAASFKPTFVGQIQFPNNQFAKAINQAWAFFIDGISEKTLNPPKDEIVQAKWVSIKDILNNTEGKLDGLKLGEEIKSTLKTAVEGKGFVQIFDKGWMSLHSAK